MRLYTHITVYRGLQPIMGARRLPLLRVERHASVVPGPPDAALDQSIHFKKRGAPLLCATSAYTQIGT